MCANAGCRFCAHKTEHKPYKNSKKCKNRFGLSLQDLIQSEIAIGRFCALIVDALAKSEGSTHWPGPDGPVSQATRYLPASDIYDEPPDRSSRSQHPWT